MADGMTGGVSGERALAGLKPHPKNYNRHPETQIKRLMRSLERFGQPKEIVTWQGFVIAGHGLVEAARRLGRPTLLAHDMSAVWNEGEALAFMAADNELARMGDPDEAALAALVAETQDFDAELAELAAGSEERLRELLAEAEQARAATESTEGAEGGETELGRWDVPDALFATDNEWGVPLLDVRMQGTAVVAPVQPWGQGAGARSRTNPGMWHFYTEDYRFQALWDDPSPIVTSGCGAVVEPNFSAYIEMAPAIVLYRTYQKRWLARFWQSMGIRVFVDLNVAENHADVNLLGVPKGWKAWATRGYTERLDATVREYERAVAHAGTEDILFFVYGGGKAVKQLCQERGWTWLMEQRDAAKAPAELTGGQNG